MDKLLYVPNPLLRQKADKIQSVGVKEKEIAKKMMTNNDKSTRCRFWQQIKLEF